METLSLVKASIRNRKGTMISFMLLTMFIVVSVITMIGVRKNYETAIQEAFKIEDKGGNTFLLTSIIFKDAFPKASFFMLEIGGARSVASRRIYHCW